jgi:hypothetical protein
MGAAGAFGQKEGGKKISQSPIFLPPSFCLTHLPPKAAGAGVREEKRASQKRAGLVKS